MIITHHGGECFKVQVGDVVLAFNPIGKDHEIKSARFGSDIALLSTKNMLTNGADQVAYADKKPFVIEGPGEYEIKGVFIRGVASEHNLDGKKGINTIYLVELEGVNLCFLGALSNPKLPSETIEALGNVDVVFVPVGGKEVLSPAEAAKFAVSLEPKVIVPMHWSGVGEKGCLDHFLKETGSKASPVDKFTFRKKEIESMKANVVVIEPVK